MRHLPMLFLIASMFISSHSMAEVSAATEADVVSKLIEQSWGEIENAPDLYPHFFVYGLEVEATAGVGDIAEVGASLGVELHFERRTP